jgi:DNA-binding NarL/FixJ family response regulator
MARQPGRPQSTATLPPLPLEPTALARAARALELSPQQARIVELLLRGLRDKQIAKEMGLGVPTVRTYLGRIFLRVGVQDRVELILRVFAVARPPRRRRSPTK